MADDAEWKYCVVGNIARNHFDDDGILRFGIPAFKGGARVSLCGKFWDETQAMISVAGLTRGHRYQVIDILPRLIENVRCAKAFTPSVLQIMDSWEFSDYWWGDKAEDKEDTSAFVIRWNQRRLNGVQ